MWRVSEYAAATQRVSVVPRPCPKFADDGVLLIHCGLAGDRRRRPERLGPTVVPGYMVVVDWCIHRASIAQSQGHGIDFLTKKLTDGDL